MQPAGFVVCLCVVFCVEWAMGASTLLVEGQRAPAGAHGADPERLETKSWGVPV